MMIGEILSVSFFLIWFSLGGLAGMITSFITPNITIQIVVFFVVSVILLLATKPLTNKFLSSKSEVSSNVDALMGKRAKVIEDIKPIDGTGKVKINGEVWKAITEDINATIPKDSEVTVIAVDGVKLIVKY
jgi:membrane protein implicated in regulation of membrane protease activity